MQAITSTALNHPLSAPDTGAKGTGHRKLRVLWLSHFVPYPPKGGCFQRSYNLLARVGEVHEVHLLALRHKRSTHPDEETLDTRDALLRHCSSVEIIDISDSTGSLQLMPRAIGGLLAGTPMSVSVYNSQEMRQRIRDLKATVGFDLVHFDTIGLAQFADEVPGLPAVMTHHGAESHMIRRRIGTETNPLRKAAFFVEWLALQSYERRMCPRFGANIVMSDDDGRLMSAIAPGTPFQTVENGVDTSYFAPAAAPSGRRIVFAGRLDQYSNRHGMTVFMEQTWPLVQERYPDASIDIIGSNPSPALRAMAGDRVRVHGFVPDVRPYFNAATLAVCPLWDGGGTRIKVLDTLAQGTAMVATSIACEGIAVVHDRDALIGETPADLAAHIGRLFDDPALRERLTANGRRLVERCYSWDTVAPKLIGLYEQVLNQSGPATAR